MKKSLRDQTANWKDMIIYVSICSIYLQIESEINFEFIIIIINKIMDFYWEKAN